MGYEQAEYSYRKPKQNWYEPNPLPKIIDNDILETDTCDESLMKIKDEDRGEIIKWLMKSKVQKLLNLIWTRAIDITLPKH